MAEPLPLETSLTHPNLEVGGLNLFFYKKKKKKHTLNLQSSETKFHGNSTDVCVQHSHGQLLVLSTDPCQREVCGCLCRIFAIHWVCSETCASELRIPFYLKGQKGSALRVQYSKTNKTKQNEILYNVKAHTFQTLPAIGELIT